MIFNFSIVQVHYVFCLLNLNVLFKYLIKCYRVVLANDVFLLDASLIYFFPYWRPKCVKLGGETDSAIRRIKRTGVTSPRGREGS